MYYDKEPLQSLAQMSYRGARSPFNRRDELGLKLRGPRELGIRNQHAISLIDYRR